MSSGGPDEWGVGAIGVVAVGVAPGVDEVWVGIIRAADHRRFGFEVTFGGWGAVVLVGSKEIAKEISGTSWGGDCGGAGGADGVGTVIGIKAVTSGLQGSDFSFGGGVGTVTPNGSRGTEGEPCEDADDGDDSEEFDQGEGRWLTQRSQSPDRVGVKTEKRDLTWECEMRNSEFEKREG